MNTYNLSWSEGIELFGMALPIVVIASLVLAITSLAFMILLGLWIYNDAQERTDHATLWTMIVLLFPFVGLIIYLLVGRDKSKQSSGRYMKSAIMIGICFAVAMVVTVASAIYLLSVVIQSDLNIDGWHPFFYLDW